MKILLVDDSRSARSLTAACLVEMGFPAIEARDAGVAPEIDSSAVHSASAGAS
jgi:DNA-binding response OmpR family regulator